MKSIEKYAVRSIGVENPRAVLLHARLGSHFAKNALLRPRRLWLNRSFRHGQLFCQFADTISFRVNKPVRSVDERSYILR